MYDLLIKGGKLIDDSPCEVGIKDGKIVKTAQQLEGEAKEILDISGSYLSYGWIDDHVHCYEKMNLYYDFPDEIGVAKGVATVIDAGSTGAANMEDFYQLAQKAKTNVYAMVNISKFGIVEQDELADLSKVDEALLKEVLKKYPDFIVGIKARMSKTVIGDNGITPLQLAKKIQADNHHLPLMVHIGSEPPKLDEVLDTLEKGDIMTHCFNGKPNGILDQTTDTIKEFVLDAYNKGIIFDIGHGTDSFNFHVAETALMNDLKAASISTDIYVRNRVNGPVYDLPTTMEKLHVVGYSWEEILDKVTRVPAENFHLTHKGELKPENDADITVFTFTEKDKELTDSNGFKRTAKEQILPLKTIIGGKVYDSQLS